MHFNIFSSLSFSEKVDVFEVLNFTEEIELSGKKEGLDLTKLLIHCFLLSPA